MRISDWSSDVCSSDLVGKLLVAEIPPAADQFDHLGLAAEGIRIDRAFMLTEETDDRRDVGRDRRVDAEQIGDRKVPAILAVPPGQQDVCDPEGLSGVGSGNCVEAHEGVVCGGLAEGSLNPAFMLTQPWG